METFHSPAFLQEHLQNSSPKEEGPTHLLNVKDKHGCSCQRIVTFV